MDPEVKTNAEAKKERAIELLQENGGDSSFMLIVGQEDGMRSIHLTHPHSVSAVTLFAGHLGVLCQALNKDPPVMCASGVATAQKMGLFEGGVQKL